jgi:hypothetical protein
MCKTEIKVTFLLSLLVNKSLPIRLVADLLIKHIQNLQGIEGPCRPSNFSQNIPRAMVNPLSYHWAPQLLVQGN